MNHMYEYACGCAHACMCVHVPVYACHDDESAVSNLRPQTNNTLQQSNRIHNESNHDLNYKRNCHLQHDSNKHDNLKHDEDSKAQTEDTM